MTNFQISGNEPAASGPQAEEMRPEVRHGQDLDPGAPLPANEEERLALLQQCRILDTPADPDFDDLTRLAAHICGTPTAVISIIDKERQWFKSRTGMEAKETPRRLAFCAHAILDINHLLIVPDATKDPRFATNELVTGAPHIRFYAGAPLVMEGGFALGTLCVIDYQPREISIDQQEALLALARQVVSQIQLRRQNQALHEAKLDRAEFFSRPLDMLCIASTDGFFKLVNPAFTETLGFSTEELLNQPIVEFIHPHDRAAAQAEMARVLKGWPANNFQRRFQCKNGTYRWLNWKWAKASDDVLYGSASDITHQKKLQEMLLRQQNELRVLFDYIPALIVFKDTENRLLKVNQKLADAMGLPVEEIEGKSAFDLYPQEDANKYYRDDLEVIHSAQPKLGIVEKLQDHDDNEVWIQTDKVPVCDPAGQVIGVVAMAMDISEQKKSQSRLIESEKRFREAIEYSAIGMALVGIDGGWMKVNHALSRMLGWSEEELLTRNFQDITHPDDLDADLAKVGALLSGEITHYQMEKRYAHQLGHYVRALLAVTLVRDTEGEPRYFVAQIEDITERYESERRMKASLLEKETLLQEVHHRVKNNMQVVSSLLSLQSNYVTDPSMKALFEECQGRIKAMALIHEQLYQSENLANVSLKQYLDTLASSVFRNHATGNKVRLELNVQPLAASIETVVPLALLINELLTNTLKHAFPNSRPGILQVGFKISPEGLATLTVEDDGVGLPENFQMNRPKTLGLRLVDIFVRQLGAKITIHSKSPGTCFEIQFKLTPPADGSAA